MKNTRLVLLQIMLFIVIFFTSALCHDNKAENTRVFTEESPQPKMETPVNQNDPAFLMKAGEINPEEISLGKLAREMGSIVPAGM